MIQVALPTTRSNIIHIIEDYLPSPSLIWSQILGYYPQGDFIRSQSPINLENLDNTSTGFPL